MPSLVVTINLGSTPPDRPGIPLSQTLREVADVIDGQTTVASSFTYKDRYGLIATKATWTYS